jgi:hypothetical protein
VIQRSVVFAGLIFAVAGLTSHGAAEYQLAPIVSRYGIGRLATGEWLLAFGKGLPVAAKPGITSLAIGPGRDELAYTTEPNSGGQSQLWTVSVADISQRGGRDEHGAASRLLWTAPAGARLHGPIWWSPDGSKLAVVAHGGDELGDSMCVDYVSGAAERLAQDVAVMGAAWEPDSSCIAYVVQADEKQSVWLQTVPPSEARRLGEGGHHLRWTPNGGLRWLRADSEESWTELTWDADAELARETAMVPGRLPGAAWSPSGAFCAVLEPANSGDEEHLIIYRANSAEGETLSLPDAHPERLLGWSPDSHLLLVLCRNDNLLAVTPRPPDPGLVARLITDEAGSTLEDLAARASLAGWGMVDPGAGPPAWSSNTDLLAYVCADEDAWRRVHPRVGPGVPFGQLVVEKIVRTHVEPSRLTGNPEVEQVVSNARNIALALQMYMADHGDVLPLAEDVEQLMAALLEYVPRRSVFLRPGTDDEVIVQYLAEPGMRFKDMADPRTEEVAIIDYHPDFYVVAYGDGHVKLFEKK